MMDDPVLAIAVPLIVEFEGFRSKPYQDGGGIWTIGFGATYLPNNKPVTPTTAPMSEPDAMAWLQTIVAKTMAEVRKMVYVPISNNAAAALCSFAYNTGTRALRESNLMDRLNAGEPMSEVAACFAAWVYAAGRYNQGLVNRRKLEKALFLTPDVTITEITTPEVTADDLNSQELNRLNNGVPA